VIRAERRFEARAIVCFARTETSEARHEGALTVQVERNVLSISEKNSVLSIHPQEIHGPCTGFAQVEFIAGPEAEMKIRVQQFGGERTGGNHEHGDRSAVRWNAGQVAAAALPPLERRGCHRVKMLGGCREKGAAVRSTSDER
jgi:hypothetical protein